MRSLQETKFWTFAPFKIPWFDHCPFPRLSRLRRGDYIPTHYLGKEDVGREKSTTISFNIVLVESWTWDILVLKPYWIDAPLKFTQKLELMDKGGQCISMLEIVFLSSRLPPCLWSKYLIFASSLRWIRNTFSSPISNGCGTHTPPPPY
jgi:hypothetical protein